MYASEGTLISSSNNCDINIFFFQAMIAAVKMTMELKPVKISIIW